MYLVLEHLIDMELTIDKQKDKKIDTNTPNDFFPTKRIL